MFLRYRPRVALRSGSLRPFPPHSRHPSPSRHPTPGLPSPPPGGSLCPHHPSLVSCPVTSRGRLRVTLPLRTSAQLTVMGRPSVWQSAPLPASVGVTTGQSGWPRRCFIATSRSLTRPRLPVTGRPISRLRLVLPLAGRGSRVNADTRSWNLPRSESPLHFWHRRSSSAPTAEHPAPLPGRSCRLAVRLLGRHGSALHSLP